MRKAVVRWLIAAGLVVAAGGLVLTTTSTSFGSPADPTHVVDVTKPGDATGYYVFRNGHFHLVFIKYKVLETVDSHGKVLDVGEIEDTVDGAAQLAKLPPIDPAYTTVSPTPAQVAEVRALVGVTPDPNRVLVPPKL